MDYERLTLCRKKIYKMKFVSNTGLSFMSNTAWSLVLPLIPHRLYFGKSKTGIQNLRPVSRFFYWATVEHNLKVLDTFSRS